MTPLEKLAKEVGFHDSYLNTFNEQIFASDKSRQALLTAMGYDTSSEEKILACTEQLINEPWLRLVSATHIIHSEAEDYEIEVVRKATDKNKTLYWLIITEKGEEFSGKLRFDKIAPVSEKTIDHILYCRYRITLPKVAEGYHLFKASIKNNITSETVMDTEDCQLIVAPKYCYGPKDVADYKMWGFAAQVYSLTSNNNWGIGDFTDLDNLVIKAAEQGASTIGLNPLHPLFPGNTAHRSPYSPTSRTFLNTIYIDVTAIEYFSECKKAMTIYNSDGFQQRLLAAKQSKLIDYQLTANLKYEILELLYAHFVEEHLQKATKQCKSFNAFRKCFGEELKNLATFDALYEHFRSLNSEAYGWMNWPEEYQDPKSSAVKNFQNNHALRISYFEYIQWIADQQLGNVANHAKEKNMPVGLYLDLAVGCDGGGADVWCNRSVYVTGGSVGAPPDATNFLGQDWGLTPINPIELTKQGYQPLVQALRSNMRHAGALRIDHVLGYMRQYWVAPGVGSEEGIYISFPFEEMLRIIALESQRAKCIVIGEDLGTTPEGFGEIMAAAGLLSYKLLSFERWESGLFKRPELYPEQSMVTVSTHDLPTLRGWWTGRDLEWRQNLSLYPNEEMGIEDRTNRIGDRTMLVDALKDMQLLDDESVPSSTPAQMNDALAMAVQRYLAKAPSRIQLIPLEDALDILEQVNIPGTIDEHPNWLQKLPYSMDDIWSQESMLNLTEVMHQERSSKL